MVSIMDVEVGAEVKDDHKSSPSEPNNIEPEGASNALAGVSSSSSGSGSSSSVPAPMLPPPRIRNFPMAMRGGKPPSPRRRTALTRVEHEQLFDGRDTISGRRRRRRVTIGVGGPLQFQRGLNSSEVIPQEALVTEVLTPASPTRLAATITSRNRRLLIAREFAAPEEQNEETTRTRTP